jgi:hypothetical protein
MLTCQAVTQHWATESYLEWYVLAQKYQFVNSRVD